MKHTFLTLASWFKQSLLSVEYNNLTLTVMSRTDFWNKFSPWCSNAVNHNKHENRNSYTKKLKARIEIDFGVIRRNY